MYPYDYNVVKLKIRTGHSHSDYINASYINGFGKEGAFIAAQGPTKNTINDFMRMIWEVEIKVIVMLTGCIENGSHKCQQYWPDTGERKYDNLTIAMVTEEVFPDFTIRSLEISKGGAERRIIQHFQFTAWPDKLVPAEPFGMVQFHRKLKSSVSGQEQPVLVHCSAGVGRTGTFIAFAILYDEGKSTGCIGILSCVQELRRQRVLMVQTEVQYTFLHEVLYTALVSARPAIAINDFPAAYKLMGEQDGATGRTILDTLFQDVNEDVLRIPEIITEGTDDSKTDIFKTARMDENVDKNVDQKILAPEQYRPCLLTEVGGCNDYINAVFIPTYTQSKGLIITQLPLSHTAVDVCRLIYQLGVELIVTFTDADILDKMLPECVTQHGPFLMKYTATSDEKYFTTREISLEYIKANPTKSVKQYIFSRNLEQTNYEAVIALLMSVEAAARQGKEGVPVVVQCLNGCAQSGVFCVLWNVLERMRMDNEVAIPEIISRARTRREQIISDFGQFKMCHDIILHYIENYLVYANV